MEITYKIGTTPDIMQIIEVYNSAGLNRPTTNMARIAAMYSNSNLIISAWHNDILVGISRALTDFCYCCYLSDLSVRKEYQTMGIGKELIALTKEQIGEQTTLILLSAATAMEYYPRIGFDKIENGFIIHRIG